MPVPPPPPSPPPPPPPARRRGDADEPVGRGIRLAPGVEVAEAAVRFSATRSSGPGGQNVNKRSTKVELRVAIEDLPMPEAARTRLAKLLGERLTDDGQIVIVCDEFRSQRQNREECVNRLAEAVRRAMVKPKKRIATKPSKGARERRLTEKKQRGEIKQRRRRPREE